MKTLICILPALLLLASCGPEQIIEAAGTHVSKEFTYRPESDVLSVSNTFNVILDNTLPRGKAIIETDSAIMSQVLVNNHGDRVNIRLRGRWRISPVPMYVRISPSGFDTFHAAGACEIVSEQPFEVGNLKISATGAATVCIQNLQAENVIADAVGTSSVILEGKADEVEFSATGVSRIEASELKCRKAGVRATGTSSVLLNVSEKLSGTNIGMSEIRYAGSPLEVNVQNIGMSVLDKINE